MSKKFSHIDNHGKPSMVDVGAKKETRRSATAECRVHLPAAVRTALSEEDPVTKKGSVFQTAVLAGVMGAKRTSELIPLCHPLPLEDCQIQIERRTADTVVVTCIARTTGKTGVEMEALTGASIAALTIYDMCKGLSHDIEIGPLRLLSKSGGKREFDRIT